jgi:serine/threonine-protein kinase RsbW
MGSYTNRQDNRLEALTGGNWQCEQLSTSEEMHDFIARLTARLAAMGFGDKDIFSVRLSLEEAIVNAIRHGHRQDPTKQVQLSYVLETHQVIVEVRDEGPGFDLGAVPDPLAPENLERPGGRGVFLMNAYMTWIRYNDVGNTVTMCKVRSA